MVYPGGDGARMGRVVKACFCHISMFNNIFLCDIYKFIFKNSEWEMKKHSKYR